MMHRLKKCCHPGVGLLLIRLALGIIFLTHGIAKLKDITGTSQFFDMALPVSMSVAIVLAWIVAIVETLGGISMILGLWTRVSGWLLAIVMAVAIIFVKSKMPFAAGEIDLILLAASLGIAIAGPGTMSLDRVICRNHVCDNCDVCKHGCTNHEHHNH